MSLPLEESAGDAPDARDASASPPARQRDYSTGLRFHALSPLRFVHVFGGRNKTAEIKRLGKQRAVIVMVDS
jgi:hypothetical protein